jgi:hypothetical protein
VTQCKCHGVSGSCNIKTCWRALPTLSEIGERLKRKFTVATEVISRRVGAGRKLLPASSAMGLYNEDDLIYVTKSPDYCLRDARVGSLGTTGRYVSFMPLASSYKHSCLSSFSLFSCIPFQSIFIRYIRYSYWLRAGRPRDRSSRPSRQGFFLLHVSRQVLGPTQSPSARVKPTGCEADHSPPTSAEVKNTWIYTSTPPYVFMA